MGTSGIPCANVSGHYRDSGSKLITSYDSITIRITERGVTNPVPDTYTEDSRFNGRFERFLEECIVESGGDCLGTANNSAAYASGKNAKPPVQLEVLLEVELCISRGLVHDLVVCE